MKDPAFLFYPGDYLRDTQTMSEKTQVAYDRIMCEHMRNICISKSQLKFFTKRLSEHEIEELMYVLTENKDGFYIAWVAESISKRRSYSDSRRKNRTSKHEKDMNNISKTYVEHMEIEIENENIYKDLKKKGGVGEKGKIDFSNVYNTQWMEGTFRMLAGKITWDELLEKWHEFTIEMEARDDLYKEPAEYRKHFPNWVKFNLDKNGKESGLMKPKYELLNDL